MTLPHNSVSFAANLQRTPPTGRILLGGSVLTSQEARERARELSDLARRLTVACDRLDALVALNTPKERRAA